MSKIICRTNNDFITFHVSCVDGLRHRVRFDKNGSLLEYSHDVAEDEVIAALGGSLPPCSSARSLFEAAEAFFRIFTGQEDCSDLVSLRNALWRDSQGSCSTCYSRGTELKHFNSLRHHLGKFGITESATTKQLGRVVSWLAEQHGVENGRISNLADLEAALGYAVDVNNSYWANNWIESYYVTSGFLTIIKRLTATRSLDEIMALRERFTVQWLQDFTDSLSKKAQQKIFGNQRTLLQISKARNKDPEVVASYVNAGIYSNIYTYINNFVSPEQARTIYDAYGGNANAKKFIEENVPVARVIRELTVEER